MQFWFSDLNKPLNNKNHQKTVLLFPASCQKLGVHKIKNTVNPSCGKEDKWKC